MKKVNALTYLKNATGALANIVLTFVLLCTLAIGQAWGAGKILYDLKTSVGTEAVTTADATVTAGTSLVLSNTAGRIKLSPKAGEKFKNGDKIVFSGSIGNTSKNYGLKIFAADGTTNAGQIYVAGTTTPLACEGTLTLSADADFIYIARYDGTTTTMTDLTITRNVSDGPASTECNLSRLLFSNGFDAYIADRNITAYYMSGSTVPTIKSATVSDGATYNLVGNTLTVTAEDGTTTKDYTLTLSEVGAYRSYGSKTFDGSETWVKAIWDNGDGKKYYDIYKSVDEATNHRVLEGKNRMYLFVGPCTQIKLHVTAGRAYKISRNGVSLGTGTATNGDILTIPGDPVAAALYEVVNTSTDGSLRFNQIDIKEPATLSFSKGSTEGVVGTAPANIIATKDSPMTLPANRTLYKEGYTLTGWNDGVNSYAPGASYTPTADVTLTAEFTENTVALGDAAAVATWEFGPSNGAPVFNLDASSSAFLINQYTISGKTIDVKMDIATDSSGKFANGSRSDDVQLNANVDFTLPGIKGMTLEYIDGNAAPSTSTFGGERDVTTGTHTTTFTYNGTASTAVLHASDAGTWPKRFIVSYPARTTSNLTILDGKSSASIPAGLSYKISKGTDFSSSSTGAVSYESTNPAVATVDADGMITAVAAGTTTIVITQAADGVYAKGSKTINITVTAQLVWKDIRMNLRSDILAGNNVPNYLVVADDGSISIAAEDPGNNNPVIKAKQLNGDPKHGYINVDISAPIPAGIYHIQLGNCNFNNTNYTITTSDGSVNKSIDAKKTCDQLETSNSHSDVYLKLERGTTLNINMGNGYTPYFSIIKQEDEPTDVQVYYSKGSTGAEGTLPASTSFAKAGAFTLTAKNYTLYKEGYTLTGWSDGTTTYALGAEYTHSKSDYDVTFTPVFTPNTANLADRDADVTITWDFQKKNVGVLNVGNNTQGIYVTQALVNGSSIDVKMSYNTGTSGKIVNGSWDDWAQLAGTFTIPSAKDAQFTLESYAATTETTVGGESLFANNTDKVKTVTISSSASTVDIEPASDGSYWRYFKIVLPYVAPTHTWDFTKWSEATKTQILGASDWTTKENDSKDVYITGNEIRWNAVVNKDAEGNLMANGTAIKELEGLRHVGLSAYGLGIAFDYQTTTDGTNWGPYNSPSYLWVTGSSSSIKVPNVKAGSTFKVASESHNPSDARGFNVTVGGQAVASTPTPNTSKDLTEFTYTIPDDAKGYVDVVLTATKGCHLYYIDAETVEPGPGPEPEPVTSYIVVNNKEELVTAINTANTSTGAERVNIFIKNGTYDFGEEVHVKISGNNISIIGESMEGVILRTAPSKAIEGLSSASFIELTGTGCYFQDLTLQNALDYYGTGSAGRAGVVWDKGDKTIYKNVRMLSYQDTYFTNSSGKYRYFEGGEIHGTVDYICGSGDVFFKDVKLVNESRSRDSKSGEDVITAQNRGDNNDNPIESDRGYVFDGCTIESNCSTFLFGRSWHHARTVFMNTTIKSGTLNSHRWDPAGMNSVPDYYYEYNTKNAVGTVVTPSSKVINFTHSSGNASLETVINATQAANYSLANFFTDWTPNTLAAQVEATDITINGKVLTFPEGTYLIEKEDGTFAALVKGTSYTIPDNDHYTLRRANEMGGFGPKSELFPEKQNYPINATWDFTSNAPSRYGSLTGSIQSNVGDKLDMALTGSLRDNANAIQLSVGATLTIPVSSTRDVITVENYGGSTHNAVFNIGNRNGVEGNCTYNPQPSEVEAGYVTITITGAGKAEDSKNNNYINKISALLKGPADQPVQEGNWMRYLDNDYQDATESDWVWLDTDPARQGLLSIGVEGDNKFSKQEIKSIAGNRAARYDLTDIVDISEVDAWKIEWDAKLQQGISNDRSQSLFAIRSTASGNDAINPTKTYMYLGCDMIHVDGVTPPDGVGNANRSKTWYLKNNAGTKIPLTTGFTDFTLDNSKWYHYKFTYNGKDAKVLITDGAKVVAEASYVLDLPVGNLKDLFSTVGRMYGEADVDNITFAVYNQKPAFITDLPTDTIQAKTEYSTKLKVEAEGAINYQWFKSSTNNASTGTPIDGATGTTLVVTPEEEGVAYYYVMATNSQGVTTSKVAILNITKPIPEITKLEFGDFNFEKKAFSVTAEGVGDIHVSYDGKEYVDYNPENLSNSFALNKVTAYASTKEGRSMDVTVTLPITYDPNKPFAAWYYQDDYVNSTTKAELDHEAQNQPISREIGKFYNLINVHLPNNQTTYDVKYPTLGSADLIICTEMETGGQPIAQSLLPLVGKTPMLSYKAYNYGISSHRWEWGEPHAVEDLNIVTVNPINPWLKIFDGTKITDTSAAAATAFGTPGVEMYDKNNGAWNDAIKHLQYVDGLVSPANEFTTFATADGAGNIFMHGTNGNVETAYSENAGKVIPARYTDGTAPYMLISLNFDNAQAVSEDAIQMSGNIAEMILKGERFNTPSAGLAPEIADNGDGSAHITSNIYKGNIYYKVVEEDAEAPEFNVAEWSQVDEKGNTAKQVAGNWKVYSVVKFPTELEGTPAGVTIPTGVSEMGNGTIVGTNIRIVHFRAGTTEDIENDIYTIPSEYSILSKGAEANIGSDYKIPMNVSIVKAEPGKENEPVRPYYRFAGWTADQDVTAMTRNDRPQGFDPLNPPTPIPDNYYPNEKKPAGTLLPTTTFVRMPENDLTFTTVFTKNKISLTRASEPIIVTWDFTTNGVLYDRVDNGNGTYSDGTYTQAHLGRDVWPAEPMNVDNKALYYNRLAHVPDLSYPGNEGLSFTEQNLDVPLFLDARNVTGANNQVFQVSFNNTESATSVKTKDGMIFGIPAVYGMQIKLLGTNGTTFGGANSKSTVGGELINAAQHKLLQNVTGAGSETVTMTYMGKKDYLYVELYEGNANADIFMKGISVIYPARVNITPQIKVGDAVNNEAGKITYKPVDEEVQLSETTPFTKNVADTLTAKAAYGYKFVGWYDNDGNAIETGIISTEVDGSDNVIAATLGYTPTATGNIVAKFEAIGKVKMQVTTYRNTPADEKTPNLELNSRVVANDKGEFATFEFSTTQLGETVVFEPTYNNEAKCYEIDVTPGTEVTVHGVQIPGNRFKKWSKWTETAGNWTENTESIVTENPHTFTVADNVKYYVQYEDVSGGYMVTYQNGGETITVPLQQNSMYEYAAPRYHTAYKEGYSLLGWQNSNKYFIYNNESVESNAVITGQAGKITLEGKATVGMGDDYILTPIYAQNNALSKLAGRKAAVTVTWDFTQAQRAQVLNFGTNATGKYVARTIVQANDNKFYSCDVPMTYATGKRGRINNTSSADWCTMGQGTTLTVPACKGATITFVTRSAISAADGGTRINGVVPTLESESADGKVYTYTYTVNEDVENIDVVLGKDYSYYKSLSVNLPPISQNHEVALIASDLTDLSSKYSFNASNKTFTATGTGEPLTLKTINGTFNIYPTSSMASSSQYVAGEKGYMHCPKDGQGFTVSGMENITRIRFRQGARINTGNAWKVVANPGGKNAKGNTAKEVVLLADHKSTVPEWIEINDIYLDNNPVIAFYNLSYQENKIDKSTTAGPYDIYLFNLEMYGIAPTTDAQMTLEVGGKMENNGELTNGGGTVWVDPYTMCLPTEAEQTQFHESAVRPVEGLEHYATPRRTMQFDEGTEVVMTAEPNFGYEFQSWIDENGNVISTKSPYRFNIHKNEKIYAKYSPIGHIIYTFGGVNYEGSVPGEQQTERGQFKVPANLTLYKDDNSTLAYWINPDDPTEEKRNEGVTQEHYELTKTYAYGESNDHFTGYDVYLSPVFMDNSFTLLDVEEPATVRWPFGQKSGAPEFNIEQRTGFEMGQVKKSGSSSEFIDVRMSISAVKQANGGVGKVNNVGRSDDYAQVNQNTVFTFPMTKGMKLVVASDNSISKSKFGGAVPTTAGKTATFYSVKKGDGTHKIGGNEIDDVQLYINDGSQNFRYIEATYYPRLKQPVFTTTSAPTTSATVSVTAPATSGATNEKIYYTFTHDGTMPAEPSASNGTQVNSGTNITKGFVDGKPIIIKAINIADNRPDSKVTTYVVLPYDAGKNTAVYFFNSEDKDYDMGADPVFRNLMMESAGKFNVVPYNIRAGVPGEGDMKTHITNEKVKAYVVSDKDKNNAVVTSINTASKPVVSLHNVLDDIVTWNAARTEFTLKNTNNDNLAIFDKVLIAYNETANANDKVCVSNTGSLTHSGVNYNAAYIIGNATKALIDGNASSTWASTTTTEPQVRKQIFAGKYVSAFSLGLLAGGETTYPVDVWSDAIQVAATAEEGIGYIGCEQPSAGNMKAVVNLYRDEQNTELIRSYTINLQMVSNTDNLVFTDKDNDTETNTWNNGTWSIKKDDGFVSGNDGECFKFNNPVDLTITGPANYGIKSITFHGYDYVSGAAGGAQISPMAATTTAGSMASSVDASTIKMYNNNEYQSHVDGDLKINYPLTSTNTTTIHLEGGHQWIGSIKIEYFERMTSAINITKADLGETKAEPLTLPSNGRVAISFNSVMAEVTTEQDAKVTISGGNLASPMALSADGNISTLMFSYWNLAAGDYELTIPFAALKDIYGTPYTGSASEWDSYKVDENRFVIPFTVDAKNYTRKKFDFIVNDRDHKFNWDGTHIEGLNAVGGNGSDERKYMLFLNSKDEYFIATGEQANKDNKTSTIFTDVDNNGIMNGRTRLTAKNLSLIGESQRNEENAKGVLITSLPKEEGSSSTPTIEFKLKSCTDNYIQDLTICNKWPYNATNFAGRATAMLDNGTNTIMKNVRLESWQDTYYTQGVRGYNEDCTFMGVVDFIYGHGDYWFKNCNIVLRDRIGNNIVAANTSAAEKWGYVFDRCTIDKEYGASLVSSGSFTLGRPWQGSPAATFLNTTMKLTPTKQGWTQMSEGLVVRYHEYGSMDEAGNKLNISTRSIAGLSPAKGSDSPVLTEAEAAKFDIHTVLGGDNGFDPTEHTRQIPTIDNLYVDGQGIYWKDSQEALCYFIYYLGDGAEPNTDDPILVANIAPEYSNEAGFNLFTGDHVFRGSQTFADWYTAKTSNNEFTHGWFAVRAANQRGGLNAMSNIVEYHKVREYKARVTTGGKVSGDDSGNVWSTIYLNFNAKVPEGVYAYALTDVSAFGGQDVTETTIHLKRVSDENTPGHQDIIYKNMGYILYGPGPDHSTHTSEYHFIETGHMNVIDGQEESRTDFMKSYLSGTTGNFKGTVSNVSGVVGESGVNGWSSYYLDYNDVPVGYTSAYTLSTKTVENTSFGLGFYKYQGSTFGHHKAYLDTDVVSQLLADNNVDAHTIEQALSKGFNVVVGDVDDNITNIIHVEGNKVIDVTDTVHNIHGHKINPASMRKGEVYIINGTKIRY